MPKVDKYFIDNLLLEDPEKAITQDIVSIAHKSDHYVIAEVWSMKTKGIPAALGMRYGSRVSHRKPVAEDEAMAMLKIYCLGKVQSYKLTATFPGSNKRGQHCHTDQAPAKMSKSTHRGMKSRKIAAIVFRLLVLCSKLKAAKAQLAPYPSGLAESTFSSSQNKI